MAAVATASALCLVGLASLGPARPAGAGAAITNSIALAARTVWLTGDNSFPLSLTVRSPLPADDLGVSLELYPNVTGRSDFEQTLTGTPVANVLEALPIPLPAFQQVQALGKRTTSGPTSVTVSTVLPVTSGEAGTGPQQTAAPTLTLDCDLRQPPCDGVYPLQIALVNLEGLPLASFTTYVVYANQQSFGSALPLRVGWILPLGGSPSLTTSGSSVLAPSQEQGISSAVNLLNQYPGVGVTLETYGETALAIGSSSDELSRRLDAALRSLAASPTHELVGSTFAPIDVAGFAHGGLAGEMAVQLQLGRRAIRQEISPHVQLPSQPWVIDGPIDASSLAMLASPGIGVSEVVLPAADLAPDSWQYTATEPFMLPIGPPPSTAASVATAALSSLHTLTDGAATIVVAGSGADGETHASTTTTTTSSTTSTTLATSTTRPIATTTSTSTTSTSTTSTTSTTLPTPTTTSTPTTLPTSTTVTGTTGTPSPAGTSGPQIDAIAADKELATHFANSGNPIEQAEDLLADLAEIYFEQPFAYATTTSGHVVYQPRSVAVETPSDWQINPTMLHVLLAGLTEAQNDGILRATTVTGLFEGDPAGADGEPANRSFASSQPVTGSDTPTAGAIASARTDISALSSLDPGATSEVSTLHYDVVGGEASNLTASQRAELLGQPAAEIASLGNLLTLPEGRTVTLTSYTGQVPITIESRSAVPLHIEVVLSNPEQSTGGVGGLSFPNGASFPLVISRGTTTEEVSVNTRTSGDFALRIVLVTPDGAISIARGNLTIRSTALSELAIGLSAGALALLAVWWVRSSRRRRRDLAVEMAAAAESDPAAE
jgi:hypothetical protein